MAKGLTVSNGLQQIHKLLDDGLVSLSGSIEITGSVIPQGDNVRTIGTEQLRWADIYAVQTTVGAIFETGLETEGLKEYETGTVVVWKSGKLQPCEKDSDCLVMGVVQKGKNQPIILGAEPVLVTGVVVEGDFLTTSDKHGHARSLTKEEIAKNNLLGIIIGQALENCEGESNLIKCIINKR